MDQTTQNFKLWLEQTKDEPLEAMASFFDDRIDDYEAHMSPLGRALPLDGRAAARRHKGPA